MQNLYLNEDGDGLAAGNLNGTFTITVLDDDRYTYTASNSDTGGDSADGGGTNVRIIGHPPTKQWDEQVYSAYNGYPNTCKFHQQRLFLQVEQYQILSQVVKLLSFLTLM